MNTVSVYKIRGGVYKGKEERQTHDLVKCR